MKNKIKKLLSYCFDKWWVLPLLSAIIIGLVFMFDKIWLLLLGLLFILASVIYLFIKKRWKSGCLTSIILFVYFCIYANWFFSQFLFPNPEYIHHKYAKRYENRKEIQNITGVVIPKFDVVESRLMHLNEFDFEFEIHTIIEFFKIPEDNLFFTLDSICVLPVPSAPNNNSSYFYYGLEGIYRCWTKKGDEYQYNRNTDFGDKFLHSSDAYFYFTIKKDFKKAEIRYGNY